MRIELEHVARLRFADGTPVRSASAVAPLGEGFLVVQDDATHAAWFRDGVAAGGSPVRLLPAVAGMETFESAAGTKHLKPDLEAACPVDLPHGSGLLLLGSGSSPARLRWSLLRLDGDRPRSRVMDMAGLYDVVAAVLGVPRDVLNLEGAHVVGSSLRWYHRGLPSAGLAPGSVDLDLAAALDAVLGRARSEQVPVRNPRRYEFGAVDGVGLAITDAVTLPGGSALLSTAAEDSPDPRDDGPVVGAALAMVHGSEVVDVTALPLVAGAVPKAEGLMVLDGDARQTRLLAVADADDPATPSVAMRLLVHH
ncbi:DUF6910 family protein [Nocardioides houyundeii]|uniref:DUF6910 family protein n=1 Tax=Nocardioides houyundeii TaxID=2045452 RepID=UPI000DF3AFBE|nr:hypothetical protein [Nocardioides houyundeii]